MMKILSDIETITPEQAKLWLASHNSNNRGISRSRVAQYAKDMAEGRWTVNGEAIIFDEKGNLSNGQHRLEGCVESGCAFRSIVVRGVDPDSFITMDSGRTRGAGDVLHIAGIPGNTKRIAAAATACLRYIDGSINSRFTNIPKEVILEYVKDQPTLLEFMRRAGQKGNPMSRHASLLAAVANLVSYTYPVEAEDFFEKSMTGAGMDTNHPCLKLRNRLLSVSDEAHAQRFSCIVTAWNAFIEGRSLTKLVAPRTSRATLKGAPKKKARST